MLNKFAEFKAAGKQIKIYFATNLAIWGEIKEIAQEYVVIMHDNKPHVVNMKQIMFFHEV